MSVKKGKYTGNWANGEGGNQAEFPLLYKVVQSERSLTLNYYTLVKCEKVGEF